MNALVLVAAGKGSRMGGDTPKPYIRLAGKPLIIHTLEKFFEFDTSIRVTVVIGPGHRAFWEEAAKDWPLAQSIRLVTGGGTRLASVRNGLNTVEEEWIVGIHDAVRPLVSLETIGRCFRAARQSGSGIPVIDMEDSVRRVTGEGNSEIIERVGLKRVQTPQVFHAGRLKKAYREVPDDPHAFTDDASVFESSYGQVTLVEGNHENIKITTPADLNFAASMIL